MSFYGSVYYQLVDTFYKVITKNASTGASFPETLDTGDQEIQALGRKGILKLANGNKWINFTHNDTDNSFVIWHGKPDDSVTTELAGYKYYGDTKPNGEIINLEAGDYFSTFTSKYDEAGHLVPDTLTVQYYKMPKSEVQDDLTRLDALVGAPAFAGTKDEEGNWIEAPKESTGLFAITDAQNEQIASNEERIVLLEDVYGNDRASSASIFFDQSSALDFTEEDPYTLKNFPAAFGSIDAIRAGYFGSYSTERTVSDAILDAKRLIAEVDEKATSAITNTNYQEKRLDDYEKNTDATLAALGKLIEGNTGSITSLDGRLDVVEPKLTTAENDIVALKAKDVELGGLITSLTGTVDTKVAELTGLINARVTTETYEAKMSALDQKDSNLEAAIGDVKDTYATKVSLQEAIEALGVTDTALSGEIENLKKADGTINEAIGGLDGRVSANEGSIGTIQTSIQELSGAHTIINSNISGLQQQVNEKASQTDLNSLSNTVNGKANQVDLEALTGTVNGKAN